MSHMSNPFITSRTKMKNESRMRTDKVQTHMRRSRTWVEKCLMTEERGAGRPGCSLGRTEERSAFHAVPFINE